MNSHIEKMKSTLVTFRNKKQEAADIIQRMKATYIPKLIDEKAAALKQELSNLKWKSRDIIAAAAEAGREDARSWATLKGADLTDDAKLIQAGINLNQTDFDNLCERYKGNGSMCRLLHEYAIKRNASTQDFAEPTFAVLSTDKLWTLEKKLNKWNRYEEAAYTLLGEIDACAPDDIVVRETLNLFGEGWEV